MLYRNCKFFVNFLDFRYWQPVQISRILQKTARFFGIKNSKKYRENVDTEPKNCYSKTVSLYIILYMGVLHPFCHKMLNLWSFRVRKNQGSSVCNGAVLTLFSIVYLPRVVEQSVCVRYCTEKQNGVRSEGF